MSQNNVHAILRRVSALRGSSLFVRPPAFPHYSVRNALATLTGVSARGAVARLDARGGRPMSSNGSDGSDSKASRRTSFVSPYQWWRANADRLKTMMTSYGYLTIATYLGVYVITLASLYGAVLSDVIAGPDVDSYINGWFVKKALVGDREIHVPPAFTQFATAWVLTKTTEPLRLVVTIAAVPAIVRRAPAALLRALRVPEAAIVARHA